jgi:hypothetical protein
MATKTTGRTPLPVSDTETACRETACPSCGSEPGDPCRTSSGRYMPLVHFPRREEAIRLGHHAP